MRTIDFVSNKRITEQLGSLIDAGHFPHALLLEGDTGLGKKTLARLLACALVCREENGPCMTCSQCRKVINGYHPDVLTYAAQGGEGSFKVETVREIINEAYISPNEARYKIFLLGEVDKMNASAQNALLKILEEPPEYVIFIMTALTKTKMLETVLSRSVVMTLEGVDVQEGAQYITEHNEGIEFAEAEKALFLSNGNIGTATEILLKGRMSELTELCADICKGILANDEYMLLRTLSPLIGDRQGTALVLDMLKNIFRDAVVDTNGSNLLSGQRESAELLRKSITKKRLTQLVFLCDELRYKTLANCNSQLLVTKICCSLRQTAGR